jgi:hypothetical protein
MGVRSHLRGDRLFKGRVAAFASTPTIHCLLGRDYAREEIQLKDRLEATAFGGDRFAVVLDLDFLSRSAPPRKQ